MNHDELMSQLKDIHRGPPPSWWPPAPGYYLVVGVLVVAVFAFIMFMLARRARRFRQVLLHELTVIETNFARDNDVAQLQAQLSALFRRWAFKLDESLPKNSELDDIVVPLQKISRDKNKIVTIIDLLKTNRFHLKPTVDTALLITLSREQIKRCRI